MANPAFQPVIPLSETKLETFIQFISNGGLTASTVRQALLQLTGPVNLLQTLIPLYTSKVSWGSLAYHQPVVSINSLAPDDVFEKLIEHNLSGHCLEMVPLFASALCSLGYDFYMTGARICSTVVDPTAELGFYGWSHLVLIVTISGQKYVVDPQFVEIVEPVSLIPDQPGGIVFNGIPTNVVRLRFCPLSDIIPNKASKSGLRTWLFEYKHSPEDTVWKPAYIFSPDTEWYMEDLPVMNVWLAKATDSYLVSQFLIRRVLLVGADQAPDSDDVIASVTLSGSQTDGLLKVPTISGFVELAGDQFRVYRGGEKVIHQVITTEQEKRCVVKMWFNIDLENIPQSKRKELE